MDKEMPDIFQYTDFRCYLKELYQLRKKENRRFSQRFITSNVGSTSSGWFSDVISGRINLTADFIPRLARVFKMTPDETEQFRILVSCNQAGSLEEKNRYMQLLIANKRTGSTTVTIERFLYYTTWYIPVIREMLFFYDFVDDYKELSRMLKPSINVAEATHAIEILRELDFISPDENGFLKPKDAILRKENGFSSVHWGNFQKAAIELSAGAIERFKKEERDISAVLVGLSSESFSVAREEIAKVRKKLLELSEADANRSKVYQCNIQIFPTTKTFVEKGVCND